MKIKCFDRYHKQWLYITFGGIYDDEIYIDSSSSNYAHGKIPVEFEAIGDREDPSPKRWSDLEQFEIIKENK